MDSSITISTSGGPNSEAIAAFLKARDSYELEDAFDELVAQGVEEIAHIHTTPDGIVHVICLSVEELFGLFFMHFIERELDALVLLMQTCAQTNEVA